MKTTGHIHRLAARRASLLAGCFLLTLAPLASASANPDPLPIGEWPQSVEQTPNSVLVAKTVVEHVVTWKAYCTAGTRKRIPRLFVAILTTVATDGTGTPLPVWLFDIGAQQKEGGGKRCLWLRITRDPAGNAQLFRHDQGDMTGMQVQPNAKGYFVIQPCFWDAGAQQPKGASNYRLVAAAGTELEVVYADLGWPTHTLTLSSFQDDNGFPPPPFPGEEH